MGNEFTMEARMKEPMRLPGYPLALVVVGLMLMLSSRAIAGDHFHESYDASGSLIKNPENGKVEEFHKNGRPSFRAFFKDGKLEGLVEQWLEDGTLISRRNFRKGLYVDTMTTWNLNGKLSEITVFEDGNPIRTENFREDGSRYFLCYRLRDSTYMNIRWNGKGEVTEEKLETQPVLRMGIDP